MYDELSAFIALILVCYRANYSNKNMLSAACLFHVESKFM